MYRIYKDKLCKKQFFKWAKRLRAEIYADALSFPCFSCVVKVQAALKSALQSMNHHFALFQGAWDVYKNIVLNKLKKLITVIDDF